MTSFFYLTHKILSNITPEFIIIALIAASISALSWVLIGLGDDGL